MDLHDEVMMTSIFVQSVCLVVLICETYVSDSTWYCKRNVDEGPTPVAVVVGSGLLFRGVGHTRS